MVTKKVKITQALFSMVTGTIEAGTELVLRQVESGAWQISEPLAWQGVVIPEDCFEELPDAQEMTAEEAVRYLEETHVIEPTVADPGTEDALEAIKEALTLAYQALKGAEWDLWADGEEYCVFCGIGRHLGHSATCPRQLALEAIRGAE